MDSRRFDSLARSLASQTSRRGFLRTATALAAGALGIRQGDVGAACPPGQTANRKGECRCPAGTDACPTGCFDLKRDSTNCGACGAPCSGGSCAKGTCRCPYGQLLCNGTCRATTTDLSNCGGCGVACPASTSPCLAAVCQNGTCLLRPTNEGGACDDGNACTMADTCQNGVCVGGTPVLCTALDQCHIAGTCDPGTGQCSNPNAADGTSCNDANACTSGDSCLAGQCVGGESVVCNTENPCLSASCNPATGCVTTPRAAGTPCSDDDRCDGAETCDGAGACVDGTPIECAPAGQCQMDGVCNASTGTCDYQNKPDGSVCNTGNRCTSDSCVSGTCVQGPDVVTPTCGAPDACHLAATCNSATGACAYPDRADGTSCETGNKCTADTCMAGVCAQGEDIVTPTCTGSGQCQQNGTCDPGTGGCVGINKSNGTACDDGNVCTTNDICTDGECVGTPRSNCTPCEDFEDCPVNTNGNTCLVRTCRDNGTCGFRYLAAGVPCPTDDRCEINAVCIAAGLGTSFCAGETDISRPACVDPCDDVSQCDNRVEQCQTRACQFDAFVGRGGCIAVADASQNGNSCTDECRTCAPDDERRCIPDGACQNGVCAPGSNTYTCSPAPTIQCCFGQRDACGRGNGLACQQSSECCSNNCASGICR